MQDWNGGVCEQNCTSLSGEVKLFTHELTNHVPFGIWIVKLDLTLSINTFATLIWNGAWIFKFDSKWTPREKEEAMMESFGEDVANERIGWKQKTHWMIPLALKIQRHSANGLLWLRNSQSHHYESKGERWQKWPRVVTFNNINEDIDISKVRESDMPF